MTIMVISSHYRRDETHCVLSLLGGQLLRSRIKWLATHPQAGVRVALTLTPAFDANDHASPKHNACTLTLTQLPAPGWSEFGEVWKLRFWCCCLFGPRKFVGADLWSLICVIK